MKPIQPEKAKISDVKPMHKLINYYADRDQMLPRSLSEIYENIRDFYVIRRGKRLVACAALHVAWEDLAEIKSSAVVKTRQHEGIGRKLVEACLEDAEDLGIPTVFALSYKPEFFKKCGFTIIDKSELPQKVWGECFRCSKFPNCDEVALVYHFKDNK